MARKAKIESKVQGEEILDAEGGVKKHFVIAEPNMRVVTMTINGSAPYVQHRFSEKSRNQIIETQKAGSQAKGKKQRTPKDFEESYRNATHLSTENWYGIPAGAFRNAMISACRTVGYKMTHAKLAAFVLADGIDAEDGTPLVKIKGVPEQHVSHARNDNGKIDIRVRPMWRKWSATLTIRYDADMFAESDVVNLMTRVGLQVGIGEGRPDSKNSAGLGWGLFNVDLKSIVVESYATD